MREPATVEHVLKQELESSATIIGEAQLLLAEKRTSLSVMRTGIAVLALPSSVFSVLIATSRYYDFLRVMHFIVPLLVLNAVLVILGFYLIIRSVLRMRHYDGLMQELKRKHSSIAELID